MYRVTKLETINVCQGNEVLYCSDLYPFRFSEGHAKDERFVHQLQLRDRRLELGVVLARVLDRFGCRDDGVPLDMLDGE